jgi:membrane associated rhomboid family serine protease
MGQRDYFDKKPTLGQTNNALVFLFTINTIIFLILIFLKLVFDLEYRADANAFFNDRVLHWFTLSPQINLLINKPWSIVIYAFTNISVIGFISNMLWLWAFGYILQDLVGNKKLIPVYIYGGFFAGLFFILTSLITTTPSNFLFEGSNTAIIAVAVATTTLSPNYKIFQQIGSGFSLWILTVIYLLIDISYVAYSNWAVVASHVIAALIGFVYIQQLRIGNDWGAWMFNLVNAVQNIFNPIKKNNLKAVKTNNKTVDETQIKIDAILDKINLTGYDNLSKSDKDFLEKNTR